MYVRIVIKKMSKRFDGSIVIEDINQERKSLILK